MSVAFEERFWSKVRRDSPEKCWAWQAATDRYGYGAISAPRERRTLQAHRAAYELARGPIPVGLHVLHRCDNRACCNPDHLFLGTHRENMRDMLAKGRLRARRASKLTAERIEAIRKAKGRQSDIAARFCASLPTVSRIQAGRL